MTAASVGNESLNFIVGGEKTGGGSSLIGNYTDTKAEFESWNSNESGVDIDPITGEEYHWVKKIGVHTWWDYLG